MKQLINILHKHSSKALIFIGVMTILATIPLLKLEINNGLDVLYEKGNEQDQINQQQKKDFGNIDELVVLSYHADDIFSLHGLKFIKQIHNDIENIPGIKSCYSIVNAPYFWQEIDNEGNEISHSDPLLEEPPSSQKELDEIKNKALQSTLFQRNLIAPDGKTLGFNIVFKNNQSELDKEKIVRKIIKQYQSYPHPERFAFTGMHVFMESAGRYIKKDMITFTLAMIALMFGIMFMLYHNALISLSILLSAGIANVLTLAILSSLGQKISMATTTVPAIISALSIAYSIHIFCASKEELPHVLWANFLAILTSALGFASMIFNPVPTVQELGIFLCMGSLFTLITIFLLTTPLKLLFFPKRQGTVLITHFTHALNNWIKNHQVTIIILTITFSTITFFIFQMKLDTNYYKYFREKSTLIQHVDFVNKNLSGQYPLMLSFHSQKEDIKSPTVLLYMQNLGDWLTTLNGIDKVTSLESILRESKKSIGAENQSWETSPRLIAESHMLLESVDRTLLRYYESSDEKSALVFIRTNTISSLQYKKITEQLRQYLQSNPLPNIKFSIGGTYLNTVESADRMSQAQLRSSLWSVMAILLIVFIFMRKLSLMLYAGLVNILPILCIYGILGLLHEPLNLGTSIIAAIAFGLAVDDTIHFITHYQNHLRETMDVERALTQVFQKSIPSISFTSLVLGISFLSLGLSNFTPIMQLGIYTSLTMVLCYLFDVIFLPCLLRISTQRNRRDIRSTMPL